MVPTSFKSDHALLQTIIQTIKLKDEVRMAGTKSAHCRDNHVHYTPTLAFLNEKSMLSWLVRVGVIYFDCGITVWLVYSCTYSKRRIGMYSGCDYQSCLCTFWSCHPYFILQFHCFIYLFLLFKDTSLMLSDTIFPLVIVNGAMAQPRPSLVHC